MGSKLKTLQIIHFALCSGVFLFTTATILINRDQLFFDADFKNTFPFNPIFPFIGLATLALSTFLFKNLISKIEKTASVDWKIMQYQSAFIVSCALLEGGIFLNIVGCMMTRNTFFLAFAAISLIFLIRRKPTKDKLISALQLPYPDTEAL